MTPTASRYSGPPPKTPTSLGDAPPHLNDEQLQIPTSELYAASLSAAWSELSSSSTDFSSRPTPERVEALEPHPSRSDRPQPEHFGPYADVRKSLDWSYHVVPSRERQRLQDEIVGYVLSQRVKECKNAGDDEPCQVSETSDGEGDDCRENGVSEQRDGSGHGVEVGGGKLALFTAGCVLLFPLSPSSRRQVLIPFLSLHIAVGWVQGRGIRCESCSRHDGFDCQQTPSGASLPSLTFPLLAFCFFPLSRHNCPYWS